MAIKTAQRMGRNLVMVPPEVSLNRSVVSPGPRSFQQRPSALEQDWSLGPTRCFAHRQTRLDYRPKEHSCNRWCGKVLYGTERQHARNRLLLKGFEGGTVRVLEGNSRAAMDHMLERIESAERADGLDRVSAAEVRKALPSILRSSPFHASKQSQELLQYI